MRTVKASRKGARQKGSRFERWVAKALVNAGIEAKRAPLSGALSWLKGDVVEFNTIRPHVHECKNCETLELPLWWRQTAEQAGEGEVPVLHFTSNYQKAYSVMLAEDFDDMVASYERFEPELRLKVTDFPQRKNFWKFTDGKNMSHHILLFTVDEIKLVIMTFDMYLMLRRRDIKRRAADALTPVS